MVSQFVNLAAAVFILGFTSCMAKTHTVIWEVGTACENLAVEVGDEVAFVWSGNHDLWKLKDKTAHDNCDFDGATKLEGSFSSLKNLQAGTTYYACAVGSGAHCQNSQKITVIATEAEPSNDSDFSAANSVKTFRAIQRGFMVLAFVLPIVHSLVAVQGGSGFVHAGKLDTRPTLAHFNYLAFDFLPSLLH